MHQDTPVVRSMDANDRVGWLVGIQENDLPPKGMAEKTAREKKIMKKWEATKKPTANHVNLYLKKWKFMWELAVGFLIIILFFYLNCVPIYLPVQPHPQEPSNQLFDLQI